MKKPTDKHEKAYWDVVEHYLNCNHQVALRQAKKNIAIYKADNSTDAFKNSPELMAQKIVEYIKTKATATPIICEEIGSDPVFSLEEFRQKIELLIAKHGPDSVLGFDAGYNNVTAMILPHKGKTS